MKSPPSKTDDGLAHLSGGISPVQSQLKSVELSTPVRTSEEMKAIQPQPVVEIASDSEVQTDENCSYAVSSPAVLGQQADNEPVNLRIRQSGAMDGQEFSPTFVASSVQNKP